MNYAARRVPFKTRALRAIGISAVFISLGLMIVGADQVGHYMQVHRTGYVGN